LNLSSHKKARVRERIEAFGASLHCPAPYGSYFDPIEKPFSKPKSPPARISGTIHLGAMERCRRLHRRHHVTGSREFRRNRRM
jgi:hypothetical protein